MPFVELTNIKQQFITINPLGQHYMSRGLYNEYFVGKKMRIYYDEENGLAGLKPAEEGYKLSVSAIRVGFSCSALSKIATGKVYPKWSKKHGMFIFQIRGDEST